MAKLIFHIGMHKTGSSAIQASLSAAVDNGDFVYPKLGRAPHKAHHTDTLVKLFSSRYANIREAYKYSAKSFRADDDDENRIRQAAAEVGSGKVILSSEGAYVYLRRDDLPVVREFIEALFDDVQIVAYVRDPFGYISSAFQQNIKGSRLSRFAPQYKTYRGFKNFDRAFGRDKVHLSAFERSAFPAGDVVADFCATAGIRALPSTEVNASLSRPAVSAIFRLNRLIEHRTDKPAQNAHKEAKIAIGRHFPHSDWPKFRLSPATIEPLIAEHMDDIAWIEERLGRPLRGKYEARDGDVATEADLLHLEPGAIGELTSIAGTLSAPASAMLRKALD